MVANEHYFTYKEATLWYAITGTGSEVVFAFHGFGQSREIFNPLPDELEKEITLYSFDLFFHGKSEWGYGEIPVSKEFWKALIENFLNAHNIENFALVGFSLGARFALTTYENFAARVNHLFLLAPDGLTPNIWYELVTSSIPGRKLFKRLIAKSKLFFTLAGLLGNLKLLDQRLLRFAESQMKSHSKRNQVYNSWVTFRKLSVNPKVLQKLTQRYPNTITIVLGQHDTVITPKIINGIPVNTFRILILETGHNRLIPIFMKGGHLKSNLLRD